MAAATNVSSLLSSDEAAAFLGIAPQTLAQWRCTHRQAIPYLKIGKLVKYKLADLQAFLERNTVGAETAES